MNKALSIFNQLRPVTIGFDSMFDNFERMFEDDFFNTSSNYPAYDIVKKKDNLYDVEVALAGFNKKDIKVCYADGQLSIESAKNEKTNQRPIDSVRFSVYFVEGWISFCLSGLFGGGNCCDFTGNAAGC